MRPKIRSWKSYRIVVCLRGPVYEFDHCLTRKYSSLFWVIPSCTDSRATHGGRISYQFPKKARRITWIHSITNAHIPIYNVYTYTLTRTDIREQLVTVRREQTCIFTCLNNVHGHGPHVHKVAINTANHLIIWSLSWANFGKDVFQHTHCVHGHDLMLKLTFLCKKTQENLRNCTCTTRY